MMFTVVNNPNTAPSQALVAPRPVESGNARALLANRQFHVCGVNMRGEAPLIQASAGGAFLVGEEASKYVLQIRRANPGLPLIVEPRALRRHWASATEPFQGEGTEGAFQLDLDAELDRQRMSSDLAITPTGQIRKGDSAALKAALAGANALDREDVLFALPTSAGWLSDELLTRQLIAVINRSRHPVLLAFTDPTNPVGSMSRARAYRRIFMEATVPVVAYRADLVGFDALAHGALASAIGSYPSLRRLTPVGGRGSSIDPEDMSPHMLITDMLRFVRSTHMRREWFPNAASIKCFCVICRGDDLDRLHGSEEERRIGHNHNVVAVDNLFSGYLNLDGAGRRALWARQTAGALDTYPQLESHIGRSVKVDNLLTVWAS
ncbi:hypothetical protein LLS1_01650 [Leifsonia sp. LS1]|uniref:hypothetical protein n=1 Tax=Leifsonia sp. LS1 TaxID=2828483 RepID=UPI001CFD3666|nr:hypothetical protein [Leifsonia sp. LS1]GIT78496.1 hypothetical protein LLS1_01650 [Leifsonia sp. LS1]